MFKRRTVAIVALAIMLLCPKNAHAEEIPYDVWVIAVELGQRYGICPELICSIVYQESRFKADAVGGGGLYQGPMQVNAKLHAGRMKKLGVTDLTDLRGGMTVGVDYLAELFEKYEDVGAVLMVYSGSGKALGNYEATGRMTGYVKQVLQRSAYYERLHNK